MLLFVHNQKMKGGSIVWRILKRLARVSLSVLLAGAVVYYKKDPKYIAIAPVLSAIGKALRQAGVSIPIPF